MPRVAHVPYDNRNDTEKFFVSRIQSLVSKNSVQQKRKKAEQMTSMTK